MPHIVERITVAGATIRVFRGGPKGAGAQPLVFLHSFSELTELPFAALLALAFWAYQRRRFALLAVLISLSPLTRPEGRGAVLICGYRRAGASSHDESVERAGTQMSRPY